MTGCEALARSFTIFGEYTDAKWPTHCEHDEMFVMVSPADVSAEHIAELEELGFEANHEDENFHSFRFGSC